MNFFIPLDGDPRLAEPFWRDVRRLLEAKGFPTEPRRIHALYVACGPERTIVQVGLEDEDVGEPVLLILKAANAPFYWACTMSAGIEGAPLPVPAGKVVCEIPFD